VVSSYTPTLRALVDARTCPPEHSVGSPRMLFVGMPTTPNRPPLPNVQKEEEIVVGAFRARCTRLSGGRATRDTVTAELHDHEWVHFACHGEQDLTDPAQGALLLHDGPLTVTVLSANQYQGELAYLSGCKTAVGGINLPDEAITLAAALHFTGFRHAIATLWSVQDLAAVRVAADVYNVVVQNGVPQAVGAAAALHHAVRRLRSGRRLRPGIWAPFAHTGP
jgi:CHAT domain-containing protein